MKKQAQTEVRPQEVPLVVKKNQVYNENHVPHENQHPDENPISHENQSSDENSAARLAAWALPERA
jgi:hypothetical protein